jgi:response regulator RpfG family c-di-GMP phosphodiesterase
MTPDAMLGRPPLVLIVDPSVAARHWMWRTLSRAFGVVEAGNARGARDWIARRPDIDALIIEDDLPDQRGLDLAHELATARHPVASRTIVLARPGAEWASTALFAATLVEKGDVRSVLSKLAGWYFARDAALVRSLLREADRLITRHNA